MAKIKQLVEEQEQAHNEALDSLYEEALAWAEDVIYVDEGVRRPVFLDEDDRLYFLYDEMDFDKDDSFKERAYLHEFEGWDEQYDSAIINSYLMG